MNTKIPPAMMEAIWEEPGVIAALLRAGAEQAHRGFCKAGFGKTNPKGFTLRKRFGGQYRHDFETGGGKNG